MAGLWYRVGTISVTNGSKNVTGFGTQFKTGTYKPDKGHTFWGPDGKHYEVDYVESDTVLYLVKAYTGATASGQSYEIDITRTSTIPALSREISAQLAYAQGQYDSWQQILTGSGDVTLTAPDARQITVPALSNMLSKSGNLAGLADKPTARNNLGLGDAATKSVGVGAGDVAEGNHEHTQTVVVAGDSNTYYPVLIGGVAVRHGVAISRDVHRDGTWAGSLRLHLIGTGYAWGGDQPFLDYEFSQAWGGGNTAGCLSDVAVSSAGEGVYVWLRGGRTYSISGIGVTATVHLSGVTEANGAQFMPASTGPLYHTYRTACIDGPQVYSGPVANNKPFWNGENFPVVQGGFSPTVFGESATGSPAYTNVTGIYYRKGVEVKFELTVSFASLGAASGNLLIGGLPFFCRSETDVSVSISAYNGLSDSVSVIGSAVRGGHPDIIITKKSGSQNYAVPVQCSDFPGGGTIQISGSYILA